MPTPRRITVLTTALALLVAACSGDDPPESVAPPPPVSTTTTSPPSSSSTTPPEDSTPSSSTSTPTGGGGDCPAAEGSLPPAGATDVSEASTDVDGDGEADRVLAYRRGDGNRRVAVELAAGGSAAVDASESTIDGPSPLSVLGGADLGGDGQTVFVVTGGGASVVVVGLFQFVECAMSRVLLQSGQPAEFPVGGGVTHADGLACAGGALVQRSATSTDGERFDTTDTRFQVDGNTLVGQGAPVTDTLSGDEDALDAYSTIDCSTLERGL